MEIFECKELVDLATVKGPMEMCSSNDYVCSYCGGNRSVGSTVFVGRVNGRVVRTCCKKCFHLIVTKIDKEHPMDVSFANRVKEKKHYG